MNHNRFIIDRFSSSWMKFSLGLILALPIFIGIALFIKSGTVLHHENIFKLLFSSTWLPSERKFGFLSFIIGSIYVTFISFIIAAPICLFAGIYLSQFAPGRLIKLMHPVIDILAGLPSVIYGFWGVLIIVPFISNIISPLFGAESSGYCILAGGIVLAIMCIPYMLNMLIEVFSSVPLGLKEASLSLGASQWESVKHVVLRKGMPGVISSYGLGLAKAFGETLAVMMVVGNMAHLSFNLLHPGYPLPALIANNYGEMLSIPKYDSALMFAALILLIIILLINLIFRYFIYKTTTK